MYSMKQTIKEKKTKKSPMATQIKYADPKYDLFGKDDAKLNAQFHKYVNEHDTVNLWTDNPTKIYGVVGEKIKKTSKVKTKSIGVLMKSNTGVKRGYAFIFGWEKVVKTKNDGPCEIQLGDYI